MPVVFSPSTFTPNVLSVYTAVYGKTEVVVTGQFD